MFMSRTYVHSLCLAQNLTCSVKYSMCICYALRTVCVYVMHSGQYVYMVLNSTCESMPAADTCNKGENVHTLQQAKCFSTRY